VIVRITFLIVSFAVLTIFRAEAATNPPFSIQQREGNYWLIKPDGERFFSFGVCVVNMGQARQDFNPTNPAYAAYQHYSDSNQWANATLRRLKSWNFTTIGGWSDFAAIKRCNVDVAFTPVLHLGSTAGVPWWDMWDTNIIARMHRIARDQIVPLRDDPRVLGYYTDNEMGWWNAALFKMTLEHAPTSGQRQRLIKLLCEIYHDDWSALLKDFEAEGVQSFEELHRGGVVYLRPGGDGIRAYRRFLGLIAERYYSLVHEIVRTYDSRVLILGDRYQSFYYPEVARACANHVSVVSANLNAAWNDGTFPRFFLDTLHELTTKPLFVSEFYMCASQNRSGDRNDHGIFPTVTTQRERAVGFRHSVEAFLRVPYVVGADWFQFYDEPGQGRYDGENFNFGLVDIRGQPYKELTKVASSLDLISLKTQPHPKRIDASFGVPPAPPNPLGQFLPTLALKNWDRERGFVKPSSDFPLADLYVCWDADAVYVGLYAQDVPENDYYKNNRPPEMDCAEWLIRVGDRDKPIRVRLGPGVGQGCDEPGVTIAQFSAYNSRDVAAVALSAKSFGKTRFKRGDTLELASTFFSHCRADRADWKGKLTLVKP
jgi:hypothetical protein